MIDAQIVHDGAPASPFEVMYQHVSGVTVELSADRSDPEGKTAKVVGIDVPKDAERDDKAVRSTLIEASREVAARGAARLVSRVVRPGEIHAFNGAFGAENVTYFQEVPGTDGQLEHRVIADEQVALGIARKLYVSMAEGRVSQPNWIHAAVELGNSAVAQILAGPTADRKKMEWPFVS